MSVKGVYELAIDWNNDDDYLDTGEDVTSRTLRVEFSRGRDYASQLTGRSVGGRLTAVLNNESGDYNSFNSSSPIYGNILPGRKVHFLGGSLGTIYRNLCPNPSVETNLTGWAEYKSATGTTERSNEQAYKGLYSIKLVMTNSGAADQVVGRGTELNIPVEEGKTYSFQVWVKVTALLSCKGRLYLDFRSEAGGYLGTYYADQTSVTADFVQLKIEGTTAPAGTAYVTCNVYLWSTAASATGTAYFDAFQVEESATCSDYIDGAQSYCEWEGTAHASISHNALTLWTGFLQRLTPIPSAHQANLAQLEAIGPLGYLNEREVSLAMQTNRATGAAIGDVLDEAAWPAGDRTIDTGQTTMARFWTNRIACLTALRKVEETENGFILESRDGKVVFEDRHHRFKTPHITSQATFTDAPAGARVYDFIEQEDPLPGIFNIFSASVQRYTTGSLAILWTLSESGANSPSIEAGESKSFWAQYPNPASANDVFGVDAWTTPVATIDYTANSQANGAGTDMTSDIGVAVTKFGQTMKITLTNNHAMLTAYITLLQARGTPVTADDPVTIREEDTTSQTSYGERSCPSLAEFIPDTVEALDWCNFNLGIYKEPIPVLAITVSGNRDAIHFTEVISRDISDRITIVADNKTKLGINEDFFIEAERHMITEGGMLHRVVYECSPVTGYSKFWIIGTSLLGQSTALGY